MGRLVTYFLPPALERIKNTYCTGQRPFLYFYWTILVQVIVMQACFSETQCTLQLVLTITVSRFSNTIQEAQLSLRNCALLHVPEYFAKSLKIIQTGNIQKLGHGFLFAFHSNYGSILYHFRDSDILVDNREFFIAMHSTPPLRGGGSPSEYCHTVWCQTTEWRWRCYTTVKKSLRVCLVASTEYRRVTWRTDRHRVAIIIKR